MADEKKIVGLTPIKIHINRAKNPTIILNTALTGDKFFSNCADSSFPLLSVSFLFLLKKLPP